MVKELRLRGISDIKSANIFLPGFIKDYNRRFAKTPTSSTNLHRKSQLPAKSLRHILSYQEERIISKNLGVHYQNKVYQIQTKTAGYTMRRAKIKVHDDHGNITLIYKGKSLPYKIFEKHQKVTAIASSKQVNSMLERAQKVGLKPRAKPSQSHPWRNRMRHEKERLAV